MALSSLLSLPDLREVRHWVSPFYISILNVKSPNSPYFSVSPGQLRKYYQQRSERAVC